MAQEFCVENDICSREKHKKKKTKKKKKQKQKNERTGKPKQPSKTPVEPTTVQPDMAQKAEIIEQARKRGLPPEQMREKVRNANSRSTAGTGYHY